MADMRARVAVAEDRGVSQEVLQAGPNQQPRPVPTGAVWAVGLAFLAVFCLASLLGLVELATRNAEAARLLTAVEASEAAMVVTQERVSEAFQGVPEQPSQADVEALREELSGIAAEGQAAIAQAGIGVTEVSVLPWHAATQDAKAAYLAHNQAWVDYLGAATQDPEEFLRPQPEVNETFAAARLPLFAAVPLLDLVNGADRIIVIYDDGGDEAPSGGGQAT